MINTRVIPCLLLKNNGLVKTKRFKNPNYIGDPINAVRIFNDKEVDELIFLDINATKDNKEPQLNTIREIANECFMPFCYGGGINTKEIVKEIFKLGAEKVSINSFAVHHPEFISELSGIYGNQSIVVAIDVKKNIYGKYKVYINGGTKQTHLNPLEYAVYMEKMGAGELLINSIDRDGIMQGYDLKLLREISSSVNIPVIALGGAGNVIHLKEAVNKGGASAVAAGSMFVYYGKQKGVLINYLNKEQKEMLNF